MPSDSRPWLETSPSVYCWWPEVPDVVSSCLVVQKITSSVFTEALFDGFEA